MITSSTDFYCYKTYIGIKRHFTKWDYDYSYYNGNVRVSRAAYDKRKDKSTFQRIAATTNDPVTFFVAHLAFNPQKYITEIASDKDRYLKHVTNLETLTFRFTSELNFIGCDIQDSLKIEEGRHPVLMRKYLSGKISMETASILMGIYGVSWRNVCSIDPLFNDTALRLERYFPFLPVDREKFLKIVVDSTQKDDKYTLVA